MATASYQPFGLRRIIRNLAVMLTRLLKALPGVDPCLPSSRRQEEPATVNVASTEVPWLTPPRFTLLLIALVLVDYGAMVLGWKSFFFRDFGYFGYPLAYYHRECFWRGELPLWNPLSCNGLPFLAQWNTLTLYPPSLIYLLLPLPWSLNLFCLVHLVLGGTGMFVLARHWTGSRLGGGIAGVAFAFNGLTVNCLLWPNNIAALGWMPWVVWLVERAWREGGRRNVALAALAGAMQTLSGAPEVILFTWLILGAMMAGQSVWNGTACRWNWRVPARFSLVALLVGALTAAQLLPFLELLQQSERSTQSADALAWAMPKWGWANFLVPLFRCYETASGVFFQPGQDWTSSYYLGGTVFALALLAAWRARQRRIWLLAAVMGLGLVLALGGDGWLYPFVRKLIPQTGLVRYAIKFVVLVIFCAPLLASFAVARQLQGDDEEKSRRQKATLGMATFCLLTMGVILWCSYRLPLRGEMYSASWAHASSRAVFLVAILGILFWLSRQRVDSRAYGCAGFALLLLVWLDLRTHAPSPAPGIPPDSLAPKLVSEQWKQEQLPSPPAPGGFRAFTPSRAYNVFNQGMLSDPVKDHLCHRLVLFPNANLLDGIPLVDGFYSLYLKNQRDAWSLLYFAPTNNSMTPLLDFLGVSQIISTTNVFAWSARPAPMPFATAGQGAVFADADSTWRGLASPAFEPRRAAYLPTEAQTSVTATNAVAGRVLSQQFSAHRLDFQVEAGGPTLLVLSQSYYAPWKAFVDEKPVRLWRANGAFQAIEVPAGQHAVRFSYSDRAFQAGAGLSLGALLLCGALCLPRNRNPDRNDAPRPA
jgi:hypothetical protein